MSADARLYITTDANGNLSLGGPWAIAEVKGTPANGVLTVTEAVTLIVAANARRKSLLIYNNGNSTVYICSSAGNDASDGMPLPPGAAMPDNITYTAWYACCDTGLSSELRTLEVST